MNNEKKVTHWKFSEFVGRGLILFGMDFWEWTFVCPSCQTVQSIPDFLRETTVPIDKIEKSVGIKCVGNFTGRMGCDFSVQEEDGPSELEVDIAGEVIRLFRFPDDKELAEYRKNLFIYEI